MSFEDAKEDAFLGTVVGSHIWEMAHDGSDQDEFYLFAYDTKDYLRGIAGQDSFFRDSYKELDDGTPCDAHAHEVEKAINQLLGGNINFVIGVTSTFRLVESEWSVRLERIVRENIAANIFHSCRGLAISQYKKYASHPPSDQAARAPKIVRAIEFGERILNGEGISFEPVERRIPWDEVEQRVEDLETAYEETELPEEPDPEPYRDFLEEIRLHNYEEW